jgi:hypothetical protein
MTKVATINRQEIADLYVGGMTQAAVGVELGITKSRVCQILKELGAAARVGGSRVGNYNRSVTTDRHAAMVGMYKSGATLAEVGGQFGITRERVRQIIKVLGIDKADGGAIMRALKNTTNKVDAIRVKNEHQEKRIRAKWGMSLDDYKAHVGEHGSCANAASPMGKYMQHRQNARRRGVAWDFTFAEWWRVWQESGKWDQRGRGIGYHGYVMARWGDADTPYSIGTVYICTQSQNAKDSFIVSPAAARAAKRSAAKQAT